MYAPIACIVEKKRAVLVVIPILAVEDLENTLDIGIERAGDCVGGTLKLRDSTGVDANSAAFASAG